MQDVYGSQEATSHGYMQDGLGLPSRCNGRVNQGEVTVTGSTTRDMSKPVNSKLVNRAVYVLALSWLRSHQRSETITLV
jgi:hypothetical protein